jgi:response regulator RpfG family c-di-GMP phosphodiesterase
MDGIEAIRSLRQARELREIPIIALSASASNQEATRSLAAGANAFIAKPINFERLQEKLGELLDITWTYTQTQQTFGHRGSPEVLIPPPDPEIEALYSLAQQGSMSDICRRAEQIATLGERYEPFARELQRLAKGFQSQTILELVERCRRSPTHV